MNTSAADVGPPFSFWRIVRHALKGEHRDYTTESLHRAVLLLAVPMVLEMFMESLFAVVDVFWVSRLGMDAVAVVGLTEAVMTLVYAAAIGISFAATAIVARRIGEGDAERASQAAGQIILIGIGVALIAGAVLSYFADDILRLMGAAERVVEIGTAFARTMFAGNVTVFLLFLINAIFRGAGDAVIAMRTLWLANGLNILLAPCLIFGAGPFPELGIVGAALATILGRTAGVIYQLWHLTGRPGRIRVRVRHFKPVVADIKAIMTTAGNGVAQMLINMTSWLGLYKILAVYGSAAIAGYTIAIRILIFALLPAWGLANAAATLVGQNLGARSPDRAEQAVRIALRFNMMFLGFAALLSFVFAGPIALLFTRDAAVLDYARQALRVVSLALPCIAATMSLQGAFNGSGDTWTPTRLNFFCIWLGQVPLAWMLAHPFGLGPLGVFIAVPVSTLALAVSSEALFRKGRWKRENV